MLDLNLSAVYDEVKLPEGSGGQMDVESGTSNSSLLNADASSSAGDDDSCSTRDAFAFNFGILKVGGGGECKGNRGTRSEFVTRQLFPVAGAGELTPGQSSPPLVRANWVDLSFDQARHGGIQEVSRVMEKQQQVKKSRRGPRSRSSQYRGVTFYRRTGRWESHIWYGWHLSRNQIICAEILCTGAFLAIGLHKKI